MAGPQEQAGSRRGRQVQGLFSAMLESLDESRLVSTGLRRKGALVSAAGPVYRIWLPGGARTPTLNFSQTVLGSAQFFEILRLVWPGRAEPPSRRTT